MLRGGKASSAGHAVHLRHRRIRALGTPNGPHRVVAASALATPGGLLLSFEDDWATQGLVSTRNSVMRSAPLAASAPHASDVPRREPCGGTLHVPAETACVSVFNDMFREHENVLTHKRPLVVFDVFTTDEETE